MIGFNQLGRDFGRVLLIGLAVFFQDFDGISCAVDRDAAGNRFANSGENKIVAFAEAGEGAGARADEADLERPACGAGGFSEEQVWSNARHHGGCRGILQETPAAG